MSYSTVYDCFRIVSMVARFCVFVCAVCASQLSEFWLFVCIVFGRAASNESDRKKCTSKHNHIPQVDSWNADAQLCDAIVGSVRLIPFYVCCVCGIVNNNMLTVMSVAKNPNEYVADQRRVVWRKVMRSTLFACLLSRWISAIRVVINMKFFFSFGVCWSSFKLNVKLSFVK